MDVPQVKKEVQVKKWVKINSADCETLISAIDNLETQLATVLREEPPPPDQTASEEELLVGLASDLRTINRRIVRAISKLNEISDRLEL